MLSENLSNIIFSRYSLTRKGNLGHIWPSGNFSDDPVLVVWGGSVAQFLKKKKKKTGSQKILLRPKGKLGSGWNSRIHTVGVVLFPIPSLRTKFPVFYETHHFNINHYPAKSADMISFTGENQQPLLATRPEHDFFRSSVGSDQLSFSPTKIFYKCYTSWGFFWLFDFNLESFQKFLMF